MSAILSSVSSNGVRKHKELHMYAIKRRLRSCVIGLAAGLVTAVPVSADDTDLYINQAASVVKPNVLFILDTSGSMATE